jgi:predicted nucleotidyltransferase
VGGEAVSVVNLLDPPDASAIDRGLRRFADVARQRYRDGLKGVYLFGSRARDDHTPFSDVDVAIVVDDGIDISSETLPLSSAAYDVLLETGAEIQPWVFHEADWKHPEGASSRSLIRSVQRDAKAVWTPS